MDGIENKCQMHIQKRQRLPAEYWYARRRIRKMQKSFAAIECAITHRCNRYAEFIIGECEEFRGKFEQECGHGGR